MAQMQTSFTPQSSVSIEPQEPAKRRRKRLKRTGLQPAHIPIWTAYAAALLTVFATWYLPRILQMEFLKWLWSTSQNSDEYARRYQEITHNPFFPLGLQASVYIVLCGVTLIPLWAKRAQVTRWLAIRKSSVPFHTLALGIIGAMGAALCLNGVIMYLRQRFQIDSPAFHHMGEELIDADAVHRAFVFFRIAVTTPIAEELFFRGFLQRRLVSRHGPFLGILIASIFFGLFHHDWLHSPFAALTGLYFGYLAWRSCTLYASIVAHSVVNFGIGIMVLLLGNSSFQYPLVMSSLSLLIVIIAVVDLHFGGMAQIKKGSTTAGPGSPI